MNSRLNNVGSGLTLFISAWPVYAVFVAFVTATGWTSLPAGLLLWFTIIYALTVSTRKRFRHALVLQFAHVSFDASRASCRLARRTG